MLTCITGVWDMMDREVEMADSIDDGLVRAVMHGGLVV